MGIPPGAVQNALKKEGKDPEIINMDPEKSYASQVKKEDTDPPIKEEYAKFFKVREHFNNCHHHFCCSESFLQPLSIYRIYLISPDA